MLHIGIQEYKLFLLSLLLEIVYTLLTMVEDCRENNMQGRTRHQRVRLIAYDALVLRQYGLPTSVPSPSPTPLAPLVPTRLVLSFRQRPLLRKVRLTYERRQIADV